MLSTKLHHPCPACGAAPYESCTRGKNGGKRKPVAVFCGARPADFGEVVATGKRAPMALPA